VDGEKICDNLISICVKHLGVNFKKDTKLRDANFFSKEIHAQEREVVLILLELEHFLGFQFSDEFICNGGFNSFNSVFNYVKTRMIERE
jgi:hypothetical protein